MSWNRQFDQSLSVEKRTVLIQRKKAAKTRDIERAMARRFKYTMGQADEQAMTQFMLVGNINQEVVHG